MPGPASHMRFAGRRERSGLGACAPTSCVAGEPSLRSFCFPAPCCARLLVMPLAPHIGQDSGSLYLAPELPESLLQILSFSDLNLQNLLTSFKLNCTCTRRISHRIPLVAHQYKIKGGGESTGASNQDPIPGNNFASRFLSCPASVPG